MFCMQKHPTRKRTNQDGVGFLGELEHADIVLGDEVASVHGLKALQKHMEPGIVESCMCDSCLRNLTNSTTVINLAVNL
jgi:hypothetical protein